MSRNNVNIYESAREMAGAFAQYFVDSIQKNLKINIALSGGSTPKIVFDYLAGHYGRENFWNKVHLYWGDERCVPAEHDDSNYKMAQKHLLRKIDIPSHNIHRIHGENNPAEEAQNYSNQVRNGLRVVNGLPSFDLIILGLGADGHTASIFPNQMERLHSKNICEVAEHPDSGQKRITLSGTVINNAKEIAFLISGEEKKEKVSAILKQTGNWKNYPAAHINPDNGRIYWFLDKAAAQML